MVSSYDVWPFCFHLWIDAVGGFLVFLKPQIRVGQAGNRENDLAIMADISSRHGEFHRGESGTVLRAYSETFVNGVTADEFLLRHDDAITMRSLEMKYLQPLTWSTTAMLRITSRHRLPLSMDGVLMLGETCLVGPDPRAHIAADWTQTVYLSWHGDRYWVRSEGPMKVDGNDYRSQAPLTPSSQVEGPWGSFRLEAAKGVRT